MLAIFQLFILPAISIHPLFYSPLSPLASFVPVPLPFVLPSSLLPPLRPLPLSLPLLLPLSFPYSSPTFLSPQSPSPLFHPSFCRSPSSGPFPLTFGFLSQPPSPLAPPCSLSLPFFPPSPFFSLPFALPSLLIVSPLPFLRPPFASFPLPFTLLSPPSVFPSPPSLSSSSLLYSSLLSPTSLLLSSFTSFRLPLIPPLFLSLHPSLRPSFQLLTSIILTSIVYEEQGSGQARWRQKVLTW